MNDEQAPADATKGRNTAANAPEPDLLTPSPDRMPSARALLRVVGWAVILLWLLDAIYILAALDWLNPVSELRTCGRLVDHVWAPLFGMLLLLLPGGTLFTPREARNLASTVRFCYVFVVLYTAIAPFTILSAARIQRAMGQQLESSVVRQQQGTERAIETLQMLETRADVIAYVQHLNFEPSVFDEPSFYRLKQDLADKFRVIDAGLTQDAREGLKRKLLEVWLDAGKWCAGALIGAGGFLFLARRSRLYHDMELIAW